MSVVIITSASPWAASRLCSFPAPPSPSPGGSQDHQQTPPRRWENLRCLSLGGRVAQMTQKEGVSMQPRQRSSTVLGTSSFLENLWGFLHPASLPTRTEAVWLEREGKCEFPASGQLQIAQLWFPETSPLSIHFCREKNPPGEEQRWEGMETVVTRRL